MNRKIEDIEVFNEAFLVYCKVKGLVGINDLKKVNVFDLLHYGFSLTQIMEIQKNIIKELTNKLIEKPKEEATIVEPSKTIEQAKEIPTTIQPIETIEKVEMKSTPKIEEAVTVKKYGYKKLVQCDFLKDIQENHYSISLSKLQSVFTQKQLESFSKDGLRTLEDLKIHDPRTYKSIRAVTYDNLQLLGIFLYTVEEVKYYLSDNVVFQRFIQSEVYKLCNTRIDVNDYNTLINLLECMGEKQVIDTIFLCIDNKLNTKINDSQFKLELSKIPVMLDVALGKLCAVFKEFKITDERSLTIKMNQLKDLEEDELVSIFIDWKMDEIAYLVDVCTVIDYFLHYDLAIDIIIQLESDLKKVAITKTSDFKDTDKVMKLTKNLGIDKMTLIKNTIKSASRKY